MTAAVAAPTVDRYRLQAEVQEILFHEGALLDDWALNEWLALFTEDGRYEIAPTGIADGFSISPMEAFFYVADDWARLQQRVLRLQKPNAHVEYPHSRTRHVYGNVRVVEHSAGAVTAMLHFATFRTKNRETLTYPGSSRYRLSQTDDGFRIREKRVVLDLDALIPQGKLSIIL